MLFAIRKYLCAPSAFSAFVPFGKKCKKQESMSRHNKSMPFGKKSKKHESTECTKDFRKAKSKKAREGTARACLLEKNAKSTKAC
jgi:hypothetical protein